MKCPTCGHTHRDIKPPVIRTDVRRDQVWRSNDPRRLQQFKILDIQQVSDNLMDALVTVENVVSRKLTTIRRGSFTTGHKGYMLVTDVPHNYPVLVQWVGRLLRKAA